MTDVMRDLRDYTEQLCAAHDIGAVTLQVCDRADAEHRVFQVLNLRVPAEAPWTYQDKAIYADDPFTDVELNEAADVAHSDAPILPSDRRIASQRARCASYWAFIDQYDLSVEGVSTRRLRRGVFTIAGFLRDRRRGYAQPLPAALLERSAAMLHNMMGAELLRSTVQSNSGMTAFRRMLEPAADAPRTDTLSGREFEVARLVASGRQTKQVAYALGLSEHTIENHLRRIYAKLGIHSRAALAHMLG